MSASSDAADVTDVRLADDVPVYVVTPRGGARGPGLLYLHWFDPEAPDGNREQFVDEARQMAAEIGAVSILPQGRFPWTGDPTDADSDARRIREELATIGEAVDVLAGQPGVDAGRLAVVGHDFGGMYAVLLAADDERLAAVVVIAATPRWGDWFLPFWQISGDRHDYLRVLAPLDPISRVGEIAPRAVLFQFARNDYFIAAMTGREFERAAREPKELRAYDADHAMRVADARADRVAYLRSVLALTG